MSIDQGLINTPRHKLDLNAAWRREDQNDYRRQFIGQLDGVGTTLQMDINEALPDGRPNPFFLRPFIGGVNPQVFRKPVFNDNYRAQIAYQLDMREEKSALKWIGFHRAIGYTEYRRTIAAPNNLRYHDVILNNNFNPSVTAAGLPRNLYANNDSLTYPLYYMGAKGARGVQYANTGPVNYGGNYNASFVSATSTAYTTNEPVSIQELYFALGQQKKTILTAGGSLQSFLLGDRIVTTFGVRKDRVKTRDSLATVAVNGVLDEANLYNFGGVPRYQEGPTKTKGVVVKPFRGITRLDQEATSGSGAGRFFAQLVRGLNFYYNTSDSFQPADTAYNLYLSELPNPTGTSEEYGIGVSMFDNKFSLRLQHFDSLQIHTRSGIGVVATRSLAMDFDNSGQNLSFGLYVSPRPGISRSPRR